MNNFKDLQVYQKAFNLSKEVAKKTLTISERRLKDQLFGSITSICANLAEMTAFDSSAQKTHKLQIAIGEANESEMWLDLCKELDYLSQEEHKDFTEKLIEVRKMLIGLRRSTIDSK